MPNPPRLRAAALSIHPVLLQPRVSRSTALCRPPHERISGAAQGLGSSLHVSAVFLGHALQYERIFLWNPRGKHVGQEFVDPGCGRGESYTNWDCLFEPLSVCAASNATRSACPTTLSSIKPECRPCMAGPPLLGLPIIRAHAGHDFGVFPHDPRAEVSVSALGRPGTAAGRTVLPLPVSQLPGPQALRCRRANSVYYEAFFNETGPGAGPIPWTHNRGPEYWDGRLREHWSARGVNVTEQYLKVGKPGTVPVSTGRRAVTLSKQSCRVATNPTALRCSAAAPGCCCSPTESSLQ